MSAPGWWQLRWCSAPGGRRLGAAKNPRRFSIRLPTVSRWYVRAMHPTGGPDVGIHVGDLIAGKYRVDRILGVGGMGVVVAARHLRLEELVAIKLLLPEALADADAVRR